MSLVTSVRHNTRRAIRLLDFIVRRTVYAIKSVGAVREWYLYVYKPGWDRYRILRRYLPHKGFFIEAGANDGLRQSNTIMLEKLRRWTGLLVEPIPEKAEICRRQRPKAIVENVALVSMDYDKPAVSMWNANLMSLVKDYRSDEADYLAKGRQFLKHDPIEIEVPARTLSSLLTEHGISKVDFLSLDVEGYELEVLKGIDFTVHAPTWLLVEYADNRPEIMSLLAPRYERITLIGIDTLFRKKQN